MAELIYSTKEVYTSYLKDRVFKIPEYQRGYKWGEKQIIQLLLDIDGFETDEVEDLFYCLQNITLYPSISDENVLHVVDGQQRLTTTYLLFCYLGVQEYLKEKFLYAVRESSNVFMQKVQKESTNFIEAIVSSENFDTFCKEYQTLDFDHQDIFYMYSAIRTFDKTFEDNNINVERFKDKFIHNVKFIVNEIHSNIKEQELFMNLNTGKVPLDGADLVRAIIITRVAKEEMISFSQESIKDIVRMNEKRTRIGWELDQLNQWWASKDVANYFKPFAKIELDNQETTQFNEDINPINILYKLWASVKSDSLKLKLFENSSITALELYRELIVMHRTLVDWFSDRILYHYLGFIANNHSNFRFKKYYELWNKEGSNRDDFQYQLKSDIEKIIFRSENKNEAGFDYWSEQILNYEGDNKTNWYESKRLEEFLVLLDVIEISMKENYRFLSPIHFRKNKEDKEHIYPCTPKNIKELDKSSNDYKSIVGYLQELDKSDLFPYEEKVWKRKSDLEKEDILKELENKIHQLTPINAIGNLVLLHYSINRGFGNDYYIDKRASVVNNVQNGEYVRQHTLNVFVKGRTDVVNLNEWTFTDIENNCKSIEETLRFFFNIKQVENEESAT